MERNEEAGVPERTERLMLTAGEVWREAGVSCPHPDILLAWKEGALAEGPSGYLRFHVEEAGCPRCQAVVEDLTRKARADSGREEELGSLKAKLLSSTMTFLRKRKG